MRCYAARHFSPPAFLLVPGTDLVDARQSHVDDSRLIADIYGYDQLSFRQGDVHQLNPDQLGQFDVVLMLMFDG